MSSKDVKIKLPKTLGAIIDLMYTTRTERKKLESEAQKKKDIEVFIGKHLLKEYGKENIKGAKGKRGQVSVKKKDIPTIENFTNFVKHIKKTGEFDLFQRRCSEKAIKERWAKKKTVPGIGKFTIYTAKVHKLGGRDAEDE